MPASEKRISVSSGPSDYSKKNNVDVNVVDLESLEAEIQPEPIDDYIFGKDRNLKRGLKQRHIQMLTLVGVFGTGLFLSSGSTLHLTGNVGMVLSYLFIGIIVGLNQLAQIEISCLMPVTGAVIRHGEHFVDPAFSFALGWIGIYSSIIPNEFSATALIMNYWSDLNPAVWITVFLAVIIACNSYNVRFYGEIEFFFGCLKVFLILGLIIFCITMGLGGVRNVDRIGFRYWKDSPFREYYTDGSLGKFLSWWKASSSVIYSYGGISGISYYAGETQNPRHSIYLAGKRIFFRVFIFYMLTVFGLTLILSAKNPDIANSTGDSNGSPFVIAIKDAGIHGLPSVINAVVLTSAFSASNLGILLTSRNFFALAAKGQAPKIFLKTNKHGLPYYGVILALLFLTLAYMNASSGASTVFGWFQSLTSANLLVNWIAISINHIALQRALKAQGYSRDDLPYKMPFAHVGAYVSLFFLVILLLTGGYHNFLNGNFNVSSFISSYFVIPLYLVLFLFWKFFKKTSLKKPEDVDLMSLFKHVEQNPEQLPEKNRGWRVIKYLWE